MSDPVTTRWVLGQLKREYGPLPRQTTSSPVSELVRTVLSQNTSDVNSDRAYSCLISTFPTWEGILKADEAQVAAAIRSGGLGNIKAGRIQVMLKEILRRRGDLDLSFLRDLPLEMARKWLEELPGVGPKTAACVLLFSLGMPALPVDTHVLRVARRLGLVPGAATANRAQGLLEGVLPAERVYPFHIYLIRHGRLVCRARKPLCRRCVLRQRCPSTLAVESG
ncbi:MAG: endonuclease III [Chloroflexota bacterium]